jgi:hypothetical protein
MEPDKIYYNHLHKKYVFFILSDNDSYHAIVYDYSEKNIQYSVSFNMLLNNFNSGDDYPMVAQPHMYPFIIQALFAGERL